jgi:hypothetical protein
MISAPPRLVIQHSMARNSSSFYHASATIPVLITVTFSTPTGVVAQNLSTSDMAILRQL